MLSNRDEVIKQYNKRDKTKMSIFNGYSGFDPTDWLREKSLVTLEVAASLVDLKSRN